MPNFRPNVHPVIRLMPGYLLPLIMMVNIFRYTAVSILIHGINAPNVIQVLGITQHLAVQVAMNITSLIQMKHIWELGVIAITAMHALPVIRQEIVNRALIITQLSFH